MLCLVFRDAYSGGLPPIRSPQRLYATIALPHTPRVDGYSCPQIRSFPVWSCGLRQPNAVRNMSTVQPAGRPAAALGKRRARESQRSLMVPSPFTTFTESVMPGKQVRFIRGNIRALVTDARKDLVAILNYNAKQPAGSFLTPTQATDMTTVASDLLTILQAKKFR